VGGAGKFMSPSLLRITRPVWASSVARRGRTRKVTSRPASSSLPPKYPPIAPAPGHENPHLTLRAKKLDIAFETRMAAAIGLAEFRRRNLFEDGA